MRPRFLLAIALLLTPSFALAEAAKEKSSAQVDAAPAPPELPDARKKLIEARDRLARLRAERDRASLLREAGQTGLDLQQPVPALPTDPIRADARKSELKQTPNKTDIPTTPKSPEASPAPESRPR